MLMKIVAISFNKILFLKYGATHGYFYSLLFTVLYTAFHYFYRIPPLSTVPGHERTITGCSSQAKH